MSNLNIHQFVARNADIADAHEFSRDHRSAINSALHRAGLPTMGKARTMGDLRGIVFGEEIVATRPERKAEVAHAPVTEATPERTECNGINMSPTSAESCARTVREGDLCHDHESQRGITRADLLRARAANIAQREEYLRERAAKREAHALLAELATV